jgi:MFS family permease
VLRIGAVRAGKRRQRERTLRLQVSKDPAPNGSVYRRLLLPIYAPSLLNSASLNALLVLVPLYVLETGAGAAFAAFLIGLRGIGMLLFDLPVGILLARFGDKPVLLSGLVAMCAGALLFALSAGPWAMSVAALLSGMGSAAWIIGRQSYITDCSQTGERGRAIAVMAGIMRLGSVVGPGIGALVAEMLGFRIAFIILALTVGCAGLLVAAFTEDVRPDKPGGLVHLTRISNIVSSHTRVLVSGGLASIGLQLMRSGRVLLIPLFGYFLDLNITAIGLIVSLAAVVDATLFYPVGIVMDRYGRKWTGVPCMVLSALSLALLPLTTAYYSLLGVSLLAGFANGLGTGLLLTLGSDLAPEKTRGEFLGLWRLVGDVGHAGGPLLIGALIELATLGVAATTVAGIGLAGAAILYWLVDETLKREPAEPPGNRPAPP